MSKPHDEETIFERDYQIHADVDELMLDEGIVVIRLFGEPEEMERFRSEVKLYDGEQNPLQLELDGSLEINGQPTYNIVRAK